MHRLNWMANPGEKGMEESFGMMVNYLYIPAMLDDNHMDYSCSGEMVLGPQFLEDSIL